MGNEAMFAAVSDDTFREILVRDYAELEEALEHGLSKSVLVLSGSIIEALLVEYLDVSQTSGKTVEELCAMNLGPLIDLAHKKKAISKKTHALSHVVRDYRNLVHPGREKRLAEKPTQEDARVAASLVKMVADEVGNRRASAVGPTAAQVAAKILCDPTGLKAVRAMITEMTETERRRLLISTLPHQYSTLFPNEHSQVDLDLSQMKTIEHTFATVRASVLAALGASNTSTRQAVVSMLTDTIRHSDADSVYMYEAVYLSADLLSIASAPDRKVITDDVVSRLGNRPGTALVTAAKSAAGMLSPSQLTDLVNELRPQIAKADRAAKQRVRELLHEMWAETVAGSPEETAIEQAVKGARGFLPTTSPTSEFFDALCSEWESFHRAGEAEAPEEEIPF